MAGSSRFTRDFFHRNIPGLGHFMLGQRFAGIIGFLFFLAFPVLAIVQFRSFTRSLISLALSAYLLIVDFEEHAMILRIDVVEYWIAAMFLIAAPLATWYMLRRRVLALREQRGDHELSQWVLAWQEFRENRVAVTGLVVVVLLYCVAFLCPFLTPFQPNAFQDTSVTKFRPPFSRVHIIRLKDPRIQPTRFEPHRLGSKYADELLYLMDINKRLADEGVSSLMYIDAYHVEEAELIVTQDRDVTHLPMSQLDGAEPEQFADTRFFLLGTDSYGRDVFSRIIFGSRISLSLGFIAVLLSVTLGTFVGLSAGYFGRIVDSSLMRFVDILLAFPSLFLILVIIAVFEKLPVPRILLIVIVLGFTSWMSIARLVRGEVLSLKEREFVLAAKAVGVSHWRIILRHILPNALTPIIINATLRIGGIILVEAALSYLNLGVQQPTASWGNIIFEGKDFLSNAWWISTFPGIAIVLTVVCLNLVGDGLRDAFDPRLKGSI